MQVIGFSGSTDGIPVRQITQDKCPMDQVVIGFVKIGMTLGEQIIKFLTLLGLKFVRTKFAEIYSYDMICHVPSCGELSCYPEFCMGRLSE